MMNKNEFKAYVINALKVKGLTEVEVKEVFKTNGAVEEFANPNLNPTPMMKVDDLYENYYKSGEPLDEIIDTVYNLLSDELKVDKDNIEPDEIIAELININSNKELLKTAVHRIINEDLALIYRGHVAFFDKDDATASFVIHNLHLSMIGTTEEDLYARAFENMETTVSSMQKVAMQLMGFETDEEEETEEELRNMDDPMIVISNRSKVYGASSILHPETQAKLSRIFEDGYYILPSSIHEVIAVPKFVKEPDELIAMVREINAAEVAPDEVLSDTVYEIKNGRLERSI